MHAGDHYIVLYYALTMMKINVHFRYINTSGS